MTIASPITAADLADMLRADINGDVLTPDDASFAAAGFGFADITRGAAEVIVVAARASDVAATVRLAARAGRRVAVQTPGRFSGDGEVLIVTRLLAGVSVDPLTRTATVGVAAGWTQVLDAAEPFGLFAVAAGSELDGGTRFPGARRMPRFAPAHVVSLQVATANGELVWVDAADDPDLFGRFRAGGGSLGFVTAMTIDLLPLPSLVAGELWLPGTPDALQAWREWAAQLPANTSTSVVAGEIPDSTALQVRFAHVGDPVEASGLLAGLRSTAHVLLENVTATPWSTVTAGMRHAELARTRPLSADSGRLVGVRAS